MIVAGRPLAGRRVVTTRDERGRLDSLLAAAGADVVHVPLIAIEPVLPHPDVDLHGVDWLVVTSRHGARAVGALAAGAPHVRLAAVGSRTSEQLAGLAGRAVDVVPRRQHAAELVEAIPPGPSKVVVVQADRADATLVDGLRARGHDVSAVTGYRTVLRMPSPAEWAAAVASDAVTFASGSAAEGWAAGVGTATPRVVVCIGATTACAATEAGIKVTHVATDHSVEGLAATVIDALATRS